MRFLPLALVLAAMVSCRTPNPGSSSSSKSARIQVDPAPLVAAVVQKHGEAARPPAQRGVRQVAAFWRAGGGGVPARGEVLGAAVVFRRGQLDALLLAS